MRVSGCDSDILRVGRKSLGIGHGVVGEYCRDSLDEQSEPRLLRCVAVDCCSFDSWLENRVAVPYCKYVVAVGRLGGVCRS